MRPIEERIRYESYRCDVFDKIKDDVEAYTRDHLDRFAPASAEDAHCK